MSDKNTDKQVIENTCDIKHIKETTDKIDLKLDKFIGNHLKHIVTRKEFYITFIFILTALIALLINKNFN